MTETGFAVIRALWEAGAISMDDLVTAVELLGREGGRSHVEHFEAAISACPPRSRQTYLTNYRRLVDHFGDRPLGDVTTADLRALGASIEAASRARGQQGYGALASFIHASRSFYKAAVNDGVLASNPALALELPRRQRSVRRALTEWELNEVYDCVINHSGDATLDLLLLDFHRETAARRGGAIALRNSDLRPDRPSVLLREKGGHEREVPASPDLLIRMSALAAGRGATDPDGSVFRYRNGTPLTRRRYNTVFDLVQRHLPWARRLGVSIHWLRHTTLTDVSNAAGIRIAAAYAGHEERSVTDHYTKPAFEDLQQAHGRIFGTARHD